MTQILVNLSLGPLILVLGIIFRVYLPKKINGVYGYRTPRSMKSQEAWDYSNELSFNLMIGAGAITTLVQGSLYFFLDFGTLVMVTSGVLVGLLIIMVIYTEIQLRQRFDADGNRIK